MMPHTISPWKASVHAPSTHHGATVAFTGFVPHVGCVTLHLPGETSTPVPHEYTHPHDAATTGKQRLVATKADGTDDAEAFAATVTCVDCKGVSREHAPNGRSESANTNSRISQTVGVRKHTCKLWRLYAARGSRSRSDGSAL